MSSPPVTVALHQLPVAIFWLALDGTVVAANPAAGRLLGREAGALVGGAGPAVLQIDAGAWQALVGGREARLGEARLGEARLGEARLSEAQAEARALETGGPGEPVALARVAGAAPLRLLAAPLIHDGRRLIQVVALDVGVHPVDDAARAAEDRAAQQRLESLGLVAGGIAHDFNNLLVGVLAEASAAREDRTLAEGTREALRRIEAAATRMSQLTRQLLAYTGRGRFVTTRLDPDALLRDLGAALAKIVQPPAALDVSPGAGGVVVEADPSLLRQVVINLVANASDAAGGRVQVASRILSRGDAPWWQLEVSDDGVGIEPATLARIFDPFFTTKHDRHGLGLSAVHGIVRRMGGDIEVDSKPGQGARFRVRLPIVPGVEPPPRVRREPTRPGTRLAGLRVLVADDEPSVRATVRRLLERRGATVVVAADGLEAEARLRDERFDLVVLDIVMPGHSGYDVLAVVRATLPGLPVILMSGYAGRARGEGAEEEPDAFIEKPFTAKVLDAAIDEVLQARAG